LSLGLIVGSSCIHGFFTPQAGHISASRATGSVQSRHATISCTASVLRQLRKDDYDDFAHSSSNRGRRATMASRAFLKPSLTAGTSSQRSSASPGGARSPRSHPNVITRVALSTSARVARRGRRSPTSIPSPSSPCTTFGGSSVSGSVPAELASTATPRSAARRRKCSSPMRLFADPCRHTNRTRGVVASVTSSYFHEDPFGFEQRKCDESDHGRRGDKNGITDLPAEQH